MWSAYPIMKRLVSLPYEKGGGGGVSSTRLVGMVPVGGAIDSLLLGRVSMCVFMCVYIPTRVRTVESKPFGYIETFT